MSAFVETHMGVEILPTITIGPVTVYRRLGYRKMDVGKYVIFRGDEAIADCRTKREALHLARKEAAKKES